jgi:hypothetical protein
VKATVHVTFLDDTGKIVAYYKLSPGAHVVVPEGAFSFMVNATFSEQDEETIRLRNTDFRARRSDRQYPRTGD